MDIVSLGFLFVIVLGGGASAYAADSLGWRIGKKRLTVLNMRPKHFARLVVTIAGALIPLFTILFLAGASEPVRVWITQGRQAVLDLPGVIRERNEAQKDLDRIRTEAKALEARSAESATQIASQTKTLKAQEALLAGQGTQIAQQVERIKELGGKLNTLANAAKLSAAQAKRLTAANRNVQRALNDTKKAYAQGQRSLAALETRIETIQKETAAAQREYGAVSKDLNENNKRNLELTRANIELTGSIAELRTRTDALNAEIASLTTARDQALAEGEVAGNNLKELQVQVAGLQDARERAQRDLELYKGDFAQARTQPLSFQQGDEIARLTVPPGLSLADARTRVQAVLRLARIEAERRGARPSSNANELPAAAGLLPQTIRGKLVTPAQQIEILATELAGRKEDAVLVAGAGFNYFGSEAVALDVAAYPSPLIFQAGDVVAEGRLDSRRGDAAIYTQINEFLGGRVKERAREVKMIPVRVASEDNFGAIEPGQILQAIRTAGGEQRVYRLQAIAASDIHAGDRLKIELRLR